MQVNRTGIALILFFGVVGAFVAVVPAALGAPAQLAMILGLLGGIWFLVAVGLALYARHQQRRAAHQDWVFRNGLKGTATVLQAGSNATVNDMPLVKLQLELRVPGSAPRQASRREVMPVFAAARMRPGLVLPARFNPGDPADFVLVW
ncbi:MAG: hypothetical protein U0R71_02565 [Solirubrobacterales bacterium]